MQYMQQTNALLIPNDRLNNNGACLTNQTASWELQKLRKLKLLVPQCRACIFGAACNFASPASDVANLADVANG
jgi:hypothetical protein